MYVRNSRRLAINFTGFTRPFYGIGLDTAVRSLSGRPALFSMGSIFDLVPPSNELVDDAISMLFISSFLRVAHRPMTL